MENPPASAQVSSVDDQAGIIAQLFELQGEAVQAPSEELFGKALKQSFDLERADPDGEVVEQDTGIIIAETPDSCQMATKDAREALVNFNKDLQDNKTFLNWLKHQLALAQNMNEEECDSIADEYQKLIDDNSQRVKDSIARQ